MSTAAENRAISSSVSCREHKLLAKSKTALTSSSQPGRDRRMDSSETGLLLQPRPCLRMILREQRLTKRLKHLHPSVLPFKEHSVVERVESPTHPHQNNLQTACKSQGDRRSPTALVPVPQSLLLLLALSLHSCSSFGGDAGDLRTSPCPQTSPRGAAPPLGSDPPTLSVRDEDVSD